MIPLQDLEQSSTIGPLAYYAEPDQIEPIWVRVIRCGGEFTLTVFRSDTQLRAFDYLPAEVPAGPLDAATVTRLAREALGGDS